MITIGAASRQTGIPPDTLRKWEARHGFPVPVRTAGHQRSFRASDLAALIEISRRMASGQRAGAAIQAVKLGMQAAEPDSNTSSDVYTPAVSHALGLLLQNKLHSFEDCLASHFVQHGAGAFARHLAIPLMDAVGSLWQQGRMPVYVEHLFSSILQKVSLQHTVQSTKPEFCTPQVLLASPAGESHTLALVLLNAVLHEAGFSTVHLQGGLPAAEIAAAAKALKVRVVALSASVACPPKLLATELRSLRALLDARSELWVGGAGALRISTQIEGVKLMPSIDAAVQTLKNSVVRNPNIAGPEKGQTRD